MNKTISGVVILGGALLLSACGGGDGGGNVALESKEDAIREVYLVVGPLTDFFFTGEFFPSDSLEARSLAAKSRANPPKAAEPCSRNMGTIQSDELTGAYSLRYFDATVSENRLRTIWVNCVDDNPEGSTTTNGQTESGFDGDYFYAVATNFEERFVERASPNAPVTFSSTLRQNGSLEAHSGETESLDRVVLSSAYQDSDGRRVEVTLGRGSTPFKYVSGQNMRFDGNYSYATDSCRGGAATVTTLEPLQRDIDSYDQGRIRIESGGKTAEFTFRPGGGATLVLNGVSQDVSAEELEVLTETGAYCQ